MDMILFLAVGLAVGAALGWLVAKASSKTTSALVNAERERAERAEQELRELRETARLEATQDAKVLQEISPLSAKLMQMQAKVETMERERTTQFDTIVAQLKTQQTTDAQLRNTTNALANALTNNQTRGGWGESRLESILISAGLVESIHYEKQVITSNQDGEEIRPDIAVKLPESRYIIIDSKVPMMHYWRAVEEREKGLEASKEVIKSHMKKHMDAVKQHIKDLAEKQYFTGFETSPEFTLMFIPSEPILAATLDEENLMEFAFNNKVALVSPVSLFAVLKTVAFTWRQDSDEKVIHEIIKLGTDLYSNLRLIGKKYNLLGVSLDKAIDNYNDVLVNLDGKLLEPARDLNNRSQMRLGTDNVPSPNEITTKHKIIRNDELKEIANGEELD